MFNKNDVIKCYCDVTGLTLAFLGSSSSSFFIARFSVRVAGAVAQD